MGEDANKGWGGAIFSFLIFICLIVTICGIAQDKPKTPTPEAPKEVVLTPEEKTELDLDQAKQDKINLRIQNFQLQLQIDEAQWNQEHTKLIDKFAKAHAIDSDKWFFDPTGVFRPKAQPPAANPEPKK